MRLQGQAAEVGGSVRALLGNHEMLFHGRAALPTQTPLHGQLETERRAGKRLAARHRAPHRLAADLPALALVENRLFMHADAMFYQHYGSTIAEVNATFQRLLRDDDEDEWDQLLEDFAERMSFAMSEFEGSTNAAMMLTRYGGRTDHSRTYADPVSLRRNTPDKPVIYARDLCIDVDGGMYLGAPGFVFRLKA